MGKITTGNCNLMAENSCDCFRNGGGLFKSRGRNTIALAEVDVLPNVAVEAAASHLASFGQDRRQKDHPNTSSFFWKAGWQ